MHHSKIALLETLSYNALPALETMIYDGWILRFANGFTKRSNSINPLYSGILPLTSKHKYCVQEFHNQNLPVIYKLTSQTASEDINEFLENLDYELVDLTSVQLLNLTNTSTTPNPNKIFSQVEQITINNEPTSQWLANFLNLNPNFNFTDFQRKTMKQILQKILPRRWYNSWFEKNKCVACGLGVLQDGYYGIFDILVHLDYRRQGFASRLIQQMIEHAQSQKAHTAYLQVVKANLPAIQLYQQFGFKEEYEYWYRKEPHTKP